MEEKPNYYSILTADVRYNKELKANEKLLFSEITALANKYGYCTASNGYLADLYDVKKTTVSHWLIHLKEKNYIRIEIERNDKKEIISRKIYPVSTPIAQKSNRYSTNDQDPIAQKSKENITSINNINISDKDNSESNNKNRFNYSKFINSINEVANTNFRNSSNNRKLIHARLADGYTEEELIKVIKFKANQWKDNEKMKKYIVLTTLLRPSNFDKYIQEVEISSEPQKKKSNTSSARRPERTEEEERLYQLRLYASEHPEIYESDTEGNRAIREELERLE
jgi:uncharacterized phage protein (TIGR02220 family)